MEEKRETDNNNKKKVTIAKISFSIDGRPEKEEVTQYIKYYFLQKCALNYHTPFKQIKSEDGNFVTIEFGVPIERIEEVTQDFVRLVDNLDIPNISFSFASNNMNRENLDSLETKKREIVEKWKQYDKDGYDLKIVKGIIQEGDPKRIKFLHHLITEYQPNNISFSILVDLELDERFDYDNAEKRVKEIWEYRQKQQKFSKENTSYKVTNQAKKKEPNTTKVAEQNTKDILAKFPITPDQEDGIIRIGIGDIINYIYSDAYNIMKEAIIYDMAYFTEKVANKKSPKELALMLMDFLLFYEGRNSNRHLSYLCGTNPRRAEKILNSMICNIPIIEFAKLNNEDLANILMQYDRIETKRTPASTDYEYITAIKRMLALGKEGNLEEALQIAEKTISH